VRPEAVLGTGMGFAPLLERLVATVHPKREDAVGVDGVARALRAVRPWRRALVQRVVWPIDVEEERELLRPTAGRGGRRGTGGRRPGSRRLALGRRVRLRCCGKGGEKDERECASEHQASLLKDGVYQLWSVNNRNASW